MKLWGSKRSEISAADQAIAAGRTQLENSLKGDPQLQPLLLRYDRYAKDLWDGLSTVYQAEQILPRLVDVIIGIHRDRSAELRQRDFQRLLEPDWFQSNNAIGYVAYADLFAKNFQGIVKQIGYLKELGATYLHLMPVLNPRPGANDGGYAVMDYRTLRPDLGNIKDLELLSSELHKSGISLTLDLVLNHVAKEHEWAEKAKGGDQKYQKYFYIYKDRTEPDKYEKTLPEIFPTFAPGNFTFNEEMQAWVWTTFNEFQWDVNWSNPDVFLEYADIIGYLANKGTDCVRLDAIAFIWKRLGTDCQNQPEVHGITQALRAAAKIFSPALIFKAEAIVGPKDVVYYLGQGEHAGKVSDLAYHNSLMVQIWSAMASRDGRLLATALSRFAPVPTTTAWATYLRCHDDIGWAIDDSDTAVLNISGPAHRNFLADFYANEFNGSFARGVHFQSNPATGDRRTSGSAASLIGIGYGIESKDQGVLNAAIDRLKCAYAMVFGFGGIPLLYMGDEIALLNDNSYLEDPAKADDSRWIHRPEMDWKRADSARAGKGIEGRVFSDIQSLIAARKSLPSLHAAVTTEVFTANNPSILVFRRKHAAGTVTQIYNLSERAHTIDSYGLLAPHMREHISGKEILFTGMVEIAPYSAMWLTEVKK